MEIAWKNIEFSDKELIQGFYRQENARNCEFTFANNYLWAPYYEIRFAVIDGLLVFLSDESTFSVSFPLGKGDVKKTIEDLMRYFEEKGRKFKMHLVSPEQFERLEQMFPGKFQIVYNPDAADYVYESEKLITLSGKKLHAKRNHVNKFMEEHPDIYQSLKPKVNDLICGRTEFDKVLNMSDEAIEAAAATQDDLWVSLENDKEEEQEEL